MTRRRSTILAKRPSSSGNSTRAQRYRRGKELRRSIPRSRQALWAEPRDRSDVIDLLAEWDRRRLPGLLPIRYGRMAVSPFAFLRGAATVMARDLAGTPTTGMRVQMAGDAHASNFGLFATPERDLVFDTNDFDETLPGPWEWDLKRLATSLVLVGRQHGFPRRTVRASAAEAVRAYRRRMHAFARLPYLDTWYSHLDLDEVGREVRRDGRLLLRGEIDRARTRTEFHAFPRLATVRRGRARIRDDPPLIVHYADPKDELAVREVLEEYRETLPPERRELLDRYHLDDVARKVVGVGSVGTRCSVGLFLGDRDVLDPLFLQVKEALPSAYESVLGASRYANHAERVVVGQRMIQEASDIFLGWGSSGASDFYVRQLRDMTFAPDITALGPRALLGRAELCGTALARAHARTGDPAGLAGYMGRGDAFEEAIVAFAESYARQSAKDHATLLRAIARGRIRAGPVD